MDRGNGGPHIVIIGAGPSGLATGYFLKKRGYENVLILEKLGRVGGLCDSISCQGYSFDLGANYVTPAYTEVLKMASEVGAKFYTERPLIAVDVPADGGKAIPSTIFSVVRFDDDTGKQMGILPFLWLLVKYTWIRWRLSSIVDKPTMAGVEHQHDLCIPFSKWLTKHGLHGLTRLFELPVTMMGYGAMDETPALYPLKFMTVKTFVPMAMKEAPFIGNYVGWPKRFVQGFQRFWERISWDLEVRTNVHITSVLRRGVDEVPEGEEPLLKPIRVRYDVKEQELNQMVEDPGSIDCDYLIAACPQSVLLGRNSIACGDEVGACDDEDDNEASSEDVVAREKEREFMALTHEERDLFRQICEVWYCMTTYHVKDLDFGNLNSPLAAVYPLAPILHPRGVAKQWDDCDFVQFYSPISAYDIKRAMCEAKEARNEGKPGAKEHYKELRKVYRALLNPNGDGDPVKDVVLKNVRQTVQQMGGTIVPETDAWHTYNRFTYFQHVDTKALEEGFYTKLELLQGRNDTFYVGGATNFELVEPIVEYAKHLVESNFPTLR